MRFLSWILPMVGLGLLPVAAWATPANKAALARHYDRFLARRLDRCTTCHLPSDRANPQSLAEFPHNPFGDRLRLVGSNSPAGPGPGDITRRLDRIATEDSDGDGVSNEVELLLGTSPGDAREKPGAEALKDAGARGAEWSRFQAGYRWRPFEPVRRPGVPAFPPGQTGRNPIDAFLAADRAAHGLEPRPEATREVLLRRVYLDLIGLAPTPEEQNAFLADTRPDAYERLVDRLLMDPRHGERWGRHWMDVWRYSDWAGWTDGGQVRDSQRHIWRWRDWIVESLNADRPYDQMLREMLAADELAPLDTNALRATGFLVRNYKMLSREQWLEDTVKHTGQAFLGLTLGCAKCHDHMYDPVTQADYYAVRAVFEPHQVRTDKVPGTTNTVLDGLVRVYDQSTNPPTWFLLRGDERTPDTNRWMRPGAPVVLGGRLDVRPVSLPRPAHRPDEREHVRGDIARASEEAVRAARAARDGTTSIVQRRGRELRLATEETRHAALLAVLSAERAADSLPPGGTAPSPAATNAVIAQRVQAVAEARWTVYAAETNLAALTARLGSATNTAGFKLTNEVVAAARQVTAALAGLTRAESILAAPPDGAFTQRTGETYPPVSTGRRSAFAGWLTEPLNPLTARVAVNHVWLRRFGRGLVPTPADFGRNGRPPTHPELLDWLAAEFMSPADGTRPAWSLRELHRLMVTSAAYRMGSTPHEASLARDPDNRHWWRMESRRLEAEAVRDNILWCAGSLDTRQGGPELDQNLALTSRRRSLYLRQAAEKQPEFLQIFDGPAVTECYERHSSVLPQQALALANSELVHTQARALAAELMAAGHQSSDRFIDAAFRRLLCRVPTATELALCRASLDTGSTGTAGPSGAHRRREQLLLVLFNHHDFLTVR